MNENPNQRLFRFCPRCGKESVLIAGLKSFECCQCKFKFYINTASAGIALIFNPNGELLVTRRKHAPAKGMLDFPGGFVESGETIEESIIREVKEELNIEITSMTYFCSFPNTYLYREVLYPITDFAFFCHVRDFSLIQAADADRNRFAFDSSKAVIEKLISMKSLGPGIYS